MRPPISLPSPCLPLCHLPPSTAFRRGKQIHKGDSWGAEDVLLSRAAARRSYRALATTYLHTVWIGASFFDQVCELAAIAFHALLGAPPLTFHALLGAPPLTFHALLGALLPNQTKDDHKEAYMLTRLWATVYAAGTAILEEHRKARKKSFAIKIGNGEHEIAPSEVERRVNAGLCKVRSPSPAFSLRPRPSTPFSEHRHPSTPFEALRRPSTPFDALLSPSTRFSERRRPSPRARWLPRGPRTASGR